MSFTYYYTHWYLNMPGMTDGENVRETKNCFLSNQAWWDLCHEMFFHSVINVFVFIYNNVKQYINEPLPQQN